MRMGRTRTKDKFLPLGVRKLKGRYYWQCPFILPDGTRPTASLGADETEMRREWVKLMNKYRPPMESVFTPSGVFNELIARYRLDMLPRKAPKTQKEYERQCSKLADKFGLSRYAKSEVEASKGGFIRSMDIAMHLRQSDTPKQANREMSLMSSIFAYAKECGLTEYNPCNGVKRNTEKPRTRLPTPDENVVLSCAASKVLRLMLELTDITGMRVGDIIRLKISQIKPDHIEVKQGKTGKVQHFERSEGVNAILKEAMTLRGSLRSMNVFCTRQGQEYTESGFQSMVRRAKAKAGINGLHFHDFRANAITETHKAGRDATDFAGHGDPALTRKVYIRGPVVIKPRR